MDGFAGNKNNSAPLELELGKNKAGRCSDPTVFNHGLCFSINKNMTYLVRMC